MSSTPSGTVFATSSRLVGLSPWGLVEHLPFGQQVERAQQKSRVKHLASYHQESHWMAQECVWHADRNIGNVQDLLNWAIYLRVQANKVYAKDQCNSPQISQQVWKRLSELIDRVVVVLPKMLWYCKKMWPAVGFRTLNVPLKTLPRFPNKDEYRIWNLMSILQGRF